MRKLIKTLSVAAAVIGSSAGAVIATTPAHATNPQLASCIYHCGAGDGSGGVPKEKYEQCVALCNALYG
jgi:hypothetical protein